MDMPQDWLRDDDDGDDMMTMMMMMMTLKVLKFYSGIWKQKLNVNFKRKQVDRKLYIVCDERYLIMVYVGVLWKWFTVLRHWYQNEKEFYKTLTYKLRNNVSSENNFLAWCLVSLHSPRTLWCRPLEALLHSRLCRGRLHHHPDNKRLTNCVMLLFLLVATVYNSSHISYRLGNGAFLSDCAHIQ